MFNSKNKTDMAPEKPTNGNGTTLIGAGTTLKGDISSNSDLRIDGTVIGNIHSSAKVVIGANGVVEGDISGNQADIIGKVTGNIKAKDLLQLRGDSIVTGNLYAGKLQVNLPLLLMASVIWVLPEIVERNNVEEEEEAVLQ